MRSLAIVDYDMGNLRSVQKAFERLGHAAEVTRDPDRIAAAPGVVLPGVGAFGACMANLAAFGLVEPVRYAIASGRPFLGICLGMQLLFEESEEFGDLPEGAYTYFVHSYYPVPSDPAVVVTTTQYGVEFASSVACGNIFACQFHPEKSQQVGLLLLDNFVRQIAGGG